MRVRVRVRMRVRVRVRVKGEGEGVRPFAALCTAGSGIDHLRPVAQPTFVTNKQNKQNKKMKKNRKKKGKQKWKTRGGGERRQ